MLEMGSERGRWGRGREKRLWLDGNSCILWKLGGGLLSLFWGLPWPDLVLIDLLKIKERIVKANRTSFLNDDWASFGGLRIFEALK